MNKPIKIYSDYIEGKALDQFYTAMKEPYSVQGSLMPDAHTGYSLPIGGVVATKDVIVPAWVGYDIGCGMCALPTSFKLKNIKSNSDAIFQAIYKVIPTGFKVNDKPISDISYSNNPTEDMKKIFNHKGSNKSIGSLGSGNHFIEIGYDENEQVWVIIHSGSRGVGHGCAQHYMIIASGKGKASEGNYPLKEDSIEGKNYIQDLAFCLEFALKNRREIMKRVINVISKNCKGSADWDRLINRNHNHAEKRGDLWIHRKGATHAEDGMMGVIPGNMRDGSFIVRGKGNPESINSSSHGAGRVMGRRVAKETVDINEFKESMSGIKAKVTSGTLDESPMAYKDIFQVMKDQKDLVDVIAHVKPVINIKS